LFFARDEGLFPAPKEITFDCSCPDWASMCKHVAATLYGVGARLDENPNLFFALRRIEVADLITQAVKSTTRSLLKKADAKSSKVMENADLTDLFDIELDDETEYGQPTVTRPRRQAVRASATEKPGRGKKRVTAKSAKAKTLRRKVSVKVATRKKASKNATTTSARRSPSRRSPSARSATRAAGSAKAGTFVDVVVSAIPKRRKRMSITEICAGVDLSETQVRNAVARAVVQGRLRSQDRGVYFRP
jgi:hypothetical protein